MSITYPVIKHYLLSADKSITIEHRSKDETVVLINGNIEPDDKSGTDTTAKEKFAHDEKRKFYKNFLSSHFENLVVLSGAGTSVGYGGKTMLELWDDVTEKLTKAKMEKLCKAIGYIGTGDDFATLPKDKKDLEKLLSRANIAREFIKTYEGKAIDIDYMVAEAEKCIHEKCNILLKEDSPHEMFLNKITNRKLKDPRVKIFTLNYDTLFEQAAVKGNFTIIDGFSFSNPRTLSGRNFDYDIIYRENSRIKEEESFVPKVFHLYKPHGSINWENQDDAIVIKENPAKPLMIYPKDSKYENSYEQPFFEMMSRFQQSVRNENVLLICLGFSFGDKHVVTAIKEAVTQNPSFRLLIVSRTIRDTAAFKWFVDRATKERNITIASEEFKEFTQYFPSSKVYGDEFEIKEKEDD